MTIHLELTAGHFPRARARAALPRPHGEEVRPRPLPTAPTNPSLLNDYLSTHAAVPTFLVSGPLLAHSTLGHTQTTASQDAPPTQSLAHLSATQKVRIVMDEQSDDDSSEDGADEVEQLEASTDAIEEDAESQQPRRPRGEVARWGVVLVGPDELEGKLGDGRGHADA